MIKQKLQEDQLNALKSGDKDKLSILRYIIAQIKNKEIEKKADATDDEVISILKKNVKELKESIDAFTKGGRADLVAEYEKQLRLVIPYLPAEISEEKLIAAIRDLMEKNKDAYQQNPKIIIGVCMKELKSKADPSRIMRVLNQLIVKQ